MRIGNAVFDPQYLVGCSSEDHVIEIVLAVHEDVVKIDAHVEDQDAVSDALDTLEKSIEEPGGGGRY